MKWLNTPVKSTEYKKDKEKVELESDEPVTIKDLVPERVDKDLELEQVHAKTLMVCCVENNWFLVFYSNNIDVYCLA